MTRVAILKKFARGTIYDSFFALLLATLSICLILIAVGHDPLQVMGLFLCGSLGDLEAVYGTLMVSMPLMFSGLSLAIAFRAGLFNIGSEGQLLIGGIAAALIGHYLDLGAFTIIPMFIAAGLAGAAWSIGPILIKLYRGAHEVVGCIMMNYIAIYLCLWLVRGPFRAEASTESTPPIVEGGWFPTLDTIGITEFNFAFFFALLLAGYLYWLLFHSPFGFELQIAGTSEGAARASGIKVKKTLILAFALSGAVAGIGGAAGVSGLYGSFNSQFSPGYGFDGITIALLGRNHPAGVVLAAILFGMMRNSSKLLQWHADISPDFVFLFQGLVIMALFVAEPLRKYLTKLMGRGNIGLD